MTQDRQAGFTLVELMVVIVIIGMISAVVVLNMPSPASDLEQETEKLAARLRLAAEESIMAGELTGVRITPEGYAFVIYRRGHWLPLDLPSGQWPEGAVVRLVRDRLPVELTENLPENSPSIWFDPLGNQMSFSIDISGIDDNIKVSGEENGEIIVNPVS
ncbi:type II secretion system minor pseudopilin GspH [Emcibacter nanhaiensis]|uniref:Type II secretion system protein H n=1 Tax=Emcibacter nanhaiensis TaxID=1505037 RepID=A0A501PQB6_9PROT|nr:type II secretion system minor pseudopilin GspH [Emcibacter nanhaiensis]TPD62643.1 type II secretion system protein GspH [Emcibacter nanhaiensis]